MYYLIRFAPFNKLLREAALGRQLLSPPETPWDSVRGLGRAKTALHRIENHARQTAASRHGYVAAAAYGSSGVSAHRDCSRQSYSSNGPPGGWRNLV